LNLNPQASPRSKVKAQAPELALTTALRLTKPPDPTLPILATYRFFALRLAFLALLFFGTLAPLARASDSPIAIACLRLFTLRPERPLRSVPDLRFFTARPTLADAFFEYLRAMLILPCGKVIIVFRKGSGVATCTITLYIFVRV
jgi:hypothetical protein